MKTILPVYEPLVLSMASFTLKSNRILHPLISIASAWRKFRSLYIATELKPTAIRSVPRVRMKTTLLTTLG